jgi:hypothetical protein
MTKDTREYHVREGMEEAEAVRQWLPLVTAAMEMPTAELFLKLRRGEIEALGKPLPAGAEIIDFLEDQNSYSRGDFDDLVDAVIPHQFWTMSGIDWLSNAVTAQGNCYCDVSISVEALMRQFPGERTPVGVAEFVGDFLLVKEPSADKVRPLLTRTLGRPPAFAWEAFHVEVADLIKSGRMPEKKRLRFSIWWVGLRTRRNKSQAVRRCRRSSPPTIEDFSRVGIRVHELLLR